MLRSLPERQALNYAAARPRGLNLILSLSGSMPDAIPVAVDGLIRSRALVLDEIAARQSAGRASSERTDPAAGRAAVRTAAACQPNGARARSYVAGSIRGGG